MHEPREYFKIEISGTGDVNALLDKIDLECTKIDSRFKKDWFKLVLSWSQFVITGLNWSKVFKTGLKFKPVTNCF